MVAMYFSVSREDPDMGANEEMILDLVDVDSGKLPIKYCSSRSSET
jgi:hypothetical protein